MKRHVITRCVALWSLATAATALPVPTALRLNGLFGGGGDDDADADAPADPDASYAALLCTRIVQVPTNRTERTGRERKKATLPIDTSVGPRGARARVFVVVVVVVSDSRGAAEARGDRRRD